jgi:membrane protease YdiL (CAAX protease family)
VNTGATPSNHVQVFERLAYASVALDAVTTIAQDRALDTIIGVCVVGLILVALIWASGRGGYRWAIGGLLLWFVYGLGDSLSEHWATAPEWLRRVFPPSGNAFVRVMSSVTLALMGWALVVYLTKETKTRTSQVLLKDRQAEPAGNTFQPSWGPMMAMVWVVGLYVSTMIIALAAGDLAGLFPIELPDGTASPMLQRVAAPLQIVGVLIVASRLRCNPLDTLALRPPARPGRLILIALALVAVTVAILVTALVLQESWVSEDDIPTDKNQILNEKAVHHDGLLLSLITVGFLSPLQEEMMFRGLLLLSFFHTRLWFWGAAFLTSLLFALLHNFSTNMLLHAPYIIMGLAFAWALRATGSLWVPILMHSFKNSVAVIALSVS